MFIRLATDDVKADKKYEHIALDTVQTNSKRETEEDRLNELVMPYNLLHLLELP